MSDEGKRWGNGTRWSEADIQFVRDHMDDMGPSEIARTVGRARSSVYHKMAAIRGEEEIPVPPTKPTGVYTEVLHAYVAEDFELRGIWCKWNGYSHAVLMSRDKYMMCTLACTAK